MSDALWVAIAGSLVGTVAGVLLGWLGHTVNQWRTNGATRGQVIRDLGRFVLPPFLPPPGGGPAPIWARLDDHEQRISTLEGDHP